MGKGAGTDVLPDRSCGAWVAGVYAWGCVSDDRVYARQGAVAEYAGGFYDADGEFHGVEPAEEEGV